MITELMQTIAQAAQQRLPLPPALRELGTPVALTVAERLDAGATLPVALSDALSPELADLLAGPQPDTASAALLVAEWLRLRQADRIAAIERLTHPALGLLAVTASAVVVAAFGTAPQSAWLVATAILGAGSVVLACAANGTWALKLPHLSFAGLHAGLHARLAGCYERAALVARWRLPEERLASLLGDDLPRLAPVLAEPSAEIHCRRLAAYHRTAELDARRRLWWMVMALGYFAGGCLLLAAAIPMVDQWVGILSDIDQETFR